jgi:hypothetical protein
MLVLLILGQVTRHLESLSGEHYLATSSNFVLASCWPKAPLIKGTSHNLYDDRIK